MLWLPAQTPRAPRRVAVGARRPAPEHASLYLLELYPNAPLREEMARAGWSLAPDDDAAEMYLRAMAAAGGGRLRAVRDLERRAARPAFASQHEILDRRRVGRVRVRRPLDSRRTSGGTMSASTVEYVEPHRVGASPRRRPPAALAARTGGGGAVHGASAARGRVHGARAGRARRRRVGDLGPRPRTGTSTRASWCTAAGGFGSPREGMLLSNEVMSSFSRGRQYGKVTAFHSLVRSQGGLHATDLVPARFRSPAVLAGLVLAVALVVGTPSVTFAQEAPQAPAKPTLTFQNDAGVVLLYVKADKTADFEELMTKFKDGARQDGGGRAEAGGRRGSSSSRRPVGAGRQRPSTCWWPTRWSRTSSTGSSRTSTRGSRPRPRRSIRSGPTRRRPRRRPCSTSRRSSSASRRGRRPVVSSAPSRPRPSGFARTPLRLGARRLAQGRRHLRHQHPWHRALALHLLFDSATNVASLRAGSTSSTPSTS